MEKLDNAALAFMVTEKTIRSVSFYCELKETVDETTLQELIDQTMKTYPPFQAVLRKDASGFIWNTGRSGRWCGRRRPPQHCISRIKITAFLR